MGNERKGSYYKKRIKNKQEKRNYRFSFHNYNPPPLRDEDSYFDYIRLAPVSQEKYTPRSKLHSLVKIDLEIVVSRLHVGSGTIKIVEEEGDVFAAKDVVRDANGTPIIPGSSIKGKIESNITIITRDSCRQNVKKCNTPQLCKVCDLFGNNSLGSRIICDDFYPSSKKQIRESIVYAPVFYNYSKSDPSNRFIRFYLNLRYKEKDHYLIPLNTLRGNFKGSIQIINPRPYEPFLVLQSLLIRRTVLKNHIPLFGFLLGGGRNIGFGRCFVLEAQISYYKIKNNIPMLVNEPLRLVKTNDSNEFHQTQKIPFLNNGIFQDDEEFPLQNYPYLRSPYSYLDMSVIREIRVRKSKKTY